MPRGSTHPCDTHAWMDGQVHEPQHKIPRNEKPRKLASNFRGSVHMRGMHNNATVCCLLIFNTPRCPAINGSAGIDAPVKDIRSGTALFIAQYTIDIHMAGAAVCIVAVQPAISRQCALRLELERFILAGQIEGGGKSLAAEIHVQAAI